MLQLQFSRSTLTRVQVRIVDNGEIQHSFSLSADSLNQQKNLARQIGHPVQSFASAIVKAMSEGSSQVEYTTPELAKPTIRIRGKLSPAHTATEITGETHYDCLISALRTVDYPASEPMLSWDNLTDIACVDIDYHTVPLEQRPEFTKLALLCSLIRPIPVAYHPSHGRGAKMYYVASEGLTAAEIASAGAMAWLAVDGRATAEIKSETRHPAYDRGGESIPEIYRCTDVGIQPLNLQQIARWGERRPDEEAIEQWLLENNYERNKRYAHERCLINPAHPTHGEPVFVGDSGIFCQNCSAKGETYGSRRTPGFVPYSALVSGMDNEIYEMAFRRCHWEHAKYLLKHHFKLPEMILRLAYSAALKMLHGPHNPVVNACFAVDPIARVGGRWVFTNDPNLTTLTNRTTNILAKFPTTWNVYATETGTYIAKPDAAKVESIAHVGRTLNDFGYIDLSPIHGFQLWGRKLPYANGVVPFPSQCLHLPPESRPKYVDKKKRTADVVEASWNLLEHVFPGIDRRFVKLLIAAKGLAESGGSNVFISCAGPAGAGKSTTAAIVAGMLGDHHAETPYVKDSTRFRQSIMDGLTRGTFVVVDEIFKTAIKEKQTYRQAMDTVLTLTKNSRTHQLYVGSVTPPNCGVFVFTDIEVPQEVRDDIQLARRLIYLKLSSRIDWTTSMVANGLSSPTDFRLLSPDHAFAADVLISEYADQFFTTVQTPEELVSLCGVGYLERSTDFADTMILFRRLFDAVCDSPPLQDMDKKRIDGEGFKRISTADATDLRDVWDELADAPNGKEWKYSRRISEIDWQKQLTNWFPAATIPRGVTVDIRHFKDTTIYIRFRVGEFASPTATNEGILCLGTSGVNTDPTQPKNAGTS